MSDTRPHIIGDIWQEIPPNPYCEECEGLVEDCQCLKDDYKCPDCGWHTEDDCNCGWEEDDE